MYICIYIIPMDQSMWFIQKSHTTINMASTNHPQCFWGLIIFLLSLVNSLYLTHSSSTSRVYIVYLGSKIHDDHKLTSNHHLQLLTNVFSSEEDAKRSILYNYKHSFSGFSAMLNSSQASALAKRKEVISVFKSKTVDSQTTRSWDFLGLTTTAANSNTTHDHRHNNPLHLAYGHDIIVGVIDSGIWPESASFKEHKGIGAIPPSWRGRCVKGVKFEPRKHCNRKLIGARFYLNGYEAKYGPISQEHSINNTFSEYRSPRDFAGHGTHTASTAVGSIAGDASFPGGLGRGVARGGAPRARLAVYKACWWHFDGNGGPGWQRCVEADVLKAFDDALRDGVHVISASIGSKPPLREFFNWSASIGSFHAQQVGVTTVFPAGNYGPHASSVTNVMPWAICVAASTIDRSFPTGIVVEKGNLSVVGESFSFTGKPMTARLALADEYFDGGVCRIDYVIPATTRRGRNSNENMVVLCLSWDGDIDGDDAVSAAMAINASGVIFAEAIPKPEGPDVIPLIRLDFAQALLLRNYCLLAGDDDVRLRIGPTTTAVAAAVAPRVSYFSSRGPSSVQPDILKPDITAPGINILAAWPTRTPLIPELVDVGAAAAGAAWNFQSGTSMSCPHVSGIVALLKSAHPDWSPSAIKSALITTASTKDVSMDRIVSDESHKVSDPFDMGAGHVEPVKAMDPGLVYDMETRDYMVYLCNLGYTPEQIQALLLPCPSHDEITCDGSIDKNNYNLNYPSITVSDVTSAVTIKRTVRNVGPSKLAVYVCSVVEPDGVQVAVWPRVLVFSWFGKESTYYVTLTPVKKSGGRYDFGEIVWSNALGPHKVRTPLVVRVNTMTSSSSMPSSSLHHQHQHHHQSS